MLGKNHEEVHDGTLAEIFDELLLGIFQKLSQEYLEGLEEILGGGLGGTPVKITKKKIGRTSAVISA